MDAILMAGGYGSRMQLTENYKAKPLIPLCGKPSVEWVLSELEKSKVGKIFLVVDREELIPEYERILIKGNYRNVRVHKLNQKWNGEVISGQAILDLEQDLSDRFLLTYGNNPVPHQLYLELAENEKGISDVAVSLYKAQSDYPKKVATLHSSEIVKLRYVYAYDYKLAEGELFFDKPFCLNRDFARFMKEVEPRVSQAVIKRLENGGKVRGVLTSFPPEFHYSWELLGIEKLINNELRN